MKRIYKIIECFNVTGTGSRPMLSVAVDFVIVNVEPKLVRFTSTKTHCHVLSSRFIGLGDVILDDYSDCLINSLSCTDDSQC